MPPRQCRDQLTGRGYRRKPCQLEDKGLSRSTAARCCSLVLNPSQVEQEVECALLRVPHGFRIPSAARSWAVSQGRALMFQVSDSGAHKESDQRAEFYKVKRGFLFSPNLLTATRVNQQGRGGGGWQTALLPLQIRLWHGAQPFPGWNCVACCIIHQQTHLQHCVHNLSANPDNKADSIP